MTVIARDAVAADHLVYAWPFPLGPECEVTCNDDEQVIMCPSWLVGDRLGPGRHRWRTPDPMRPVAAFFVRTSPVEAQFDMLTSFLIPATGMPVRLRATGTLLVRCSDPGLLIAQFVGLPFDSVNEGILRSVSRSVERMLGRLLTRRVVMSGTPYAVTDPSMLGQIVEELVAYNPTAGAVFGVELIQMMHLGIAADDGSTPYIPLPVPPSTPPAYGHFGDLGSQPEIPLLETARGRPMSQHDGLFPEHTPTPLPPQGPSPATEVSSEASSVASGEIVPRKKKATEPGMAAPPIPKLGGGSGPGGSSPGHEVPRADDGVDGKSQLPGAAGIPVPRGSSPQPRTEDRGAILGIGMGAIGSSSVSGEIPMKVAPGQRVLVPGPNGLMQSATVRQLLQGYYELEVGSSGETIWVPINGVVPE